MSDVSDEDANAEAEHLWGVTAASASPHMAVVCDDCFTAMTVALPPAQWLKEAK